MLGEIARYDLLKLGMGTNNTTFDDYVFVPSSAAPTLVLYSLFSIQIPFIFYAIN